MNTFVSIRAEYSPTLNFWELNPHMIYVSPFNHLYDRDKSKDRVESSKHMWCIVWMSDPDEDTNKYYRLPTADRIDTCKRFNPLFDLEDDLIQTCITAYPDVCLTTIERALKAEKEFLDKRGMFLRNAEYGYDTMTMLDNAASKTSKILEQYDKVYQQFVESKRKSVQVHGGRQLTGREKKIIKPDLANADLDDDN